MAKNSALVKEGKKLAARIEYPEDPAQKQRIYFEESFVTNVLNWTGFIRFLLICD